MYVSLTCSGAVYFFVDDSAQSVSNDGAICDPLKGPVRSFAGTDGAASTRAGLLHARGARRRDQLLSRKQIAG